VPFPLRWYVLTTVLAGMLTLTAGIAFIGTNSTGSVASLTPDEPSVYAAHTGTRRPIVGDTIVTDGTQFGAISEEDALAIQPGSASGETLNSKYLGFNLHLSVISVGDRLVRVRAIELGKEYWLTQGAVWRNTH
jgi:hypothetical protein